MVETAITRTARALDLVPFVIEHPGISVEDLAQEFGVTTAQMVSDLSMIFMCGLPGYSTLELIDLSYDDGFVSIIDPQVLDKPRNLSKSEIISLNLALDSLASLRTEDDPLLSAIRVLQGKLQKTIADAVPHIPVIQRSELKSPLLPLCEEAVKSGSGLAISYVSASSDQHTERIILPESIHSENGYLYLRAWCYLTESTRTFRLDRIMSATAVPVSQLPQSDKSPTSTEHFKATLKISHEAKYFYEQNKSLLTIESQDEDSIVVTIQLSDSEWLTRTLMGYGAAITVLAPADLAAEVRRRAQATLELYRQL